MIKVSKENSKKMFIGIYVDDMFLLGYSDMINNTTTIIKRSLNSLLKINYMNM